MRKLVVSVILATLLIHSQAVGQVQEAQQLLLNWEKLEQLREILDNMYKGYKVLERGYNTIRDIAQGNFSLHQLFLDGLMAVNPSIKKYKKIPYIIDYQEFLLKEYRRYYDRFRQDPNFSASELQYLARVYGYLIDASLKNLDELFLVITADQLRMSDDERLQAIDRIYLDMTDKVAFLRYFNNSAQLLAIQRAKERNDVTTMRKLYELNP